MARMNLEGDMNAFMSTLRNLGSAGNGALRDALGWAESRYWKAHAALFESGQIKKGRGRGGSVSTSSSRSKSLFAKGGSVSTPISVPTNAKTTAAGQGGRI
jgi:hypothetical protein